MSDKSPSLHEDKSFEREEKDLFLTIPYPVRQKLVKYQRSTYLLAFALFITVYTYFLFAVFIRPKRINYELQMNNCPTPWVLSPAPLALNHSLVATIVEARDDPNLVPLILHFVGVLGDDWPFHIFHSAENAHRFANSASIQKYVQTGRFRLTQLPQDTVFSKGPDVSAFLINRWYWESLAPASYVLFFQLDSVLCGNSYLRVEDFFQYDMIGAPWEEEYGGANGGLSFRRRERMLEVIDKFSWEPKRDAEDVYFYSSLTMIPNTTLPTSDVSKKFSVENFWYDTPLGYHQPYHINSNRKSAFEAYCPETKLLKD